MLAGAAKSKVVHPDFAKRLEQAAESNPHVPLPNHGRLGWFVKQFEDRFEVSITVETVRKWFAGEVRPRAKMVSRLAQVLQVDEAWLSVGSVSDMTKRQRRARNAAADGAVNVIAGLISLDGGTPAFPDPGDIKAEAQRVDLYAIIRGAQYSIHVVLGETIKGGWRITVPVEATECLVLALVPTDIFCFQVLEIDPVILDEKGQRKRGSIEVEIGEDMRSGGHEWKEVTTFSERL
jgi:transcriptional regulator with XRE-family HTH domain